MPVSLSFQLFKRRNVATADEEAEEEVMSDGGFHEAQMNNMEMTSVSDTDECSAAPLGAVYHGAECLSKAMGRHYSFAVFIRCLSERKAADELTHLKTTKMPSNEQRMAA